MRIYSDKTNQFYETVKACEQAEAIYDKKVADEKAKYEADKKALEEKVAAEKALVSKRKKELSDAIELADEEYVAACKVYDVAKKQADDIMKEAREKANEILSVAAKDVEVASQKRLNAIAEFNKSFGVYRTTLTGARAADEFNRIFNAIWDWRF